MQTIHVYLYHLVILLLASLHSSRLSAPPPPYPTWAGRPRTARTSTAQDVRRQQEDKKKR